MCLDMGGYHEIGLPVNSSSVPSTKLNWKLLWMKLKKEKRKIFESDHPVQPHVPYNPYTYSQNFDQGFAWDEPDNLSRSFSMRFADPSSVFIRKTAA